MPNTEVIWLLRRGLREPAADAQLWTPNSIGTGNFAAYPALGGMERPSGCKCRPRKKHVACVGSHEILSLIGLARCVQSCCRSTKPAALSASDRSRPGMKNHRSLRVVRAEKTTADPLKSFSFAFACPHSRRRSGHPSAPSGL